MAMLNILIAIHGASGAGKSTAAEYLKARLFGTNLDVRLYDFVEIQRQILTEKLRTLGVLSARGSIEEKFSTPEEKNERIAALAGLTYRQALFDITRSLGERVCEKLWVRNTQSFFTKTKDNFLALQISTGPLDTATLNRQIRSLEKVEIFILEISREGFTDGPEIGRGKIKPGLPAQYRSISNAGDEEFFKSLDAFALNLLLHVFENKLRRIQLELMS